jgi:hypothetical protein
VNPLWHIHPIVVIISLLIVLLLYVLFLEVFLQLG